MLFAVDRIEKNIAILENLETKKIVEVSTKLLPNNIKDGSVVKYENNSYILDTNKEKEREKRIREKLEKLKKLNNN